MDEQELYKYAIALMNEIAMYAHYRIFWNTPYRTGALARGIGDVRAIANGAGFDLLTQFTQYGAILNEAPTIKYNITNKRTGKTYSGEYTNTHYRWVDNGADAIANEIMTQFPNLQRIV